MQWRIYYDDGSTFDDEQQARGERRPGYGALVIVQSDPTVGRAILRKFEYWILKDDNRWYGCDRFGLYDHIFDARAFSQCCAFVSGRNVSDEVFQRAYRAALDDPDFPLKSATKEYSETPFQWQGVIE